MKLLPSHASPPLTALRSQKRHFQKPTTIRCPIKAHGSHTVLHHRGLRSWQRSRNPPEHIILPGAVSPVSEKSLRLSAKKPKRKRLPCGCHSHLAPWGYLYATHAFSQIFSVFNLLLARCCHAFETWCWRWVYPWSKYSRWVNFTSE